MTIKEKRVKRNFKLFIMALCLLISIFTVITCLNKGEKTNKDTNKDKANIGSKDEETKGDGQIEKDTNLTKIAFEKDNNAYIYDELNGRIKSLGDNSKLKDLLKLSPDKTKVLFKYFNEGKPVYPPHVIVYDIKTENSTDIVIDNKNTQQVIELEWVDNENILVTGHINPSDSGYAVYNIKSKAQLISCVGTIMDVSLDKKNILYSNTPHIFPRPMANLYMNGNKIYESTNSKEEILDGVLSKDSKKIAFRSWVTDDNNINGEINAYINLAKVNSDGKSISDLKKISVGNVTTGDIKFDDGNNISIIGDEFVYKLKAEVIIKEENTLPKQSEPSKEQLEKFKAVLAKQFPNDFISEKTLLEDIGIYNMMAF